MNLLYKYYHLDKTVTTYLKMCIRDSSRALDAAYEPLALMCERKHISGSAAHIIKRCGDVPVYTGDRELLTTLTGYVLTRGVLLSLIHIL